MPAFESADALVAWMHDEYLSELLLRKLSPKPAARPPKSGVVTMEWGLVLPEAPPRLAAYLVRAEGVSRWSLEGAWKKDRELEIRGVHPRDGGIELTMAAPGSLTLVAERVSIEAGPIRAYRPPAQPNPARLLFMGPREVSWIELSAWLAPADGLELYGQQRPQPMARLVPNDAIIVAPYFETVRLQSTLSDPEPELCISWMLAATMRGHYFTVERGSASDAQWSRVLRLPEQLGATEVMSGGVRVTGPKWMSEWVPRLTRKA